MDQSLPLDELADAPEGTLGDAPEGESWESRMLREHAELAMKLCRRIVKQAEDANWLGVGGDQMFARISHAMQVSIALKRKLEIEAAQERRRAEREEAEWAKERAVQAAMEAKERAAEAEQQALAAKKADDSRIWQVRTQVKEVIDTLPPAITQTISTLRLEQRLKLRLADLDVTREIVGRPVAEVVAQICREIGIPTPDEIPLAETPEEAAEARVDRRATQLAKATAMLAQVKDLKASRLAERLEPDAVPPPESRHDPP